jgi:hypothetical protein
MGACEHEGVFVQPLEIALHRKVARLTGRAMVCPPTPKHACLGPDHPAIFPPKVMQS